MKTVAQAVTELRRLQTKRVEDALPTLWQTPLFRDYAGQYIEAVSAGRGAKKPGAVEEEKACLARWSEMIGGLRLPQIKRLHVNQFISACQNQGVSNRTLFERVWFSG